MANVSGWGALPHPCLRSARQTAPRSRRAWGPQVEDDRLLVSAEHEPPQRGAVPLVPVTARRVTARWVLHLDHLSTEVTEHHRRQWRGDDGRDVEHPEAVEGRRRPDGSTDSAGAGGRGPRRPRCHGARQVPLVCGARGRDRSGPAAGHRRQGGPGLRPPPLSSQLRRLPSVVTEGPPARGGCACDPVARRAAHSGDAAAVRGRSSQGRPIPGSSQVVLGHSQLRTTTDNLQPRHASPGPRCCGPDGERAVGSTGTRCAPVATA